MNGQEPKIQSTWIIRDGKLECCWIDNATPLDQPSVIPFPQINEQKRSA